MVSWQFRAPDSFSCERFRWWSAATTNFMPFLVPSRGAVPTSYVIRATPHEHSSSADVDRKVTARDCRGRRSRQAATKSASCANSQDVADSGTAEPAVAVAGRMRSRCQLSKSRPPASRSPSASPSLWVGRKIAIRGSQQGQRKACSHYSCNPKDHESRSSQLLNKNVAIID